MFSIVFILSTIIIIMLMMFVHRDNEIKGYNAEAKRIMQEKEAEIIRLKSDSMRLETLLKGKDIHISLDVQGIPQRRGGGITVNNIQGN